MSDKLANGDEVAVYSEAGRRSDLATFHGWERRGEEWWAHVMVYGPRRDGGSGMYRDTVPAGRVVPLAYCAHNPITHEVFHRCEGDGLMERQEQVWA